MIKISAIVQDIMENDDLVKSMASKGLLNYMAYARDIQRSVEEKILKPVKLGSITAAVTRHAADLKPIDLPIEKDIQQISLQTNLEGVTYERSEEVSKRIQAIYNEIKVDNKTYITITQGINEITIIAENSVIDIFRQKLKNYRTIYDISEIVGITVKFGLKYMSIPNLFYLLIRKLALKNINIVEIVSTATELTFIINKVNLQSALEQLQKGL
jgi:aspartokinase